MPDGKKPDWKTIVSERMPSLPMPPDVEEDVIAELACHLEETYANARSRGLTAAAAVEIALQEVNDWPDLAADIRRAKSTEDPVNERTKTLWVPAMATLLSASALLMTLQRIGLQPHLVWIRSAAMVFYWPWLAGLPAFGALGAYLSKRVRGSVRTRLAAGLSPALVMLVTMCLILPWGLAVDGFSVLRLAYFGLAVVNWVAIPGLALSLGVLPFLQQPQLMEA